MSRARKTYFCLRLVEYTSIPLTFCFMLYLLSGYGMISPIPRIVGFTYDVSVKIHALPLLRLTTAVLALLHFYGGAVIILNRYVRRERMRELIESFIVIMTLVLFFIILLSELKMFY